MLHNALNEAVSQVVELIDRCPSIYVDVSPAASSAIGQHVRHIHDHLYAYQCGIGSGCIDYNLRNRLSDVETSPEIAIKKLETFKLWLQQSPQDSLQLSVTTEVSTLDSVSITLQSNSHRELVYLLNHTYHHVALAATLARTLGFHMPGRLGVAPATVTHRRGAGLSCAP